MPYDTSGNYVRVHNWQEDRDNGIRILAQRMDEEDDSIAGALNQAFLRSGVVPMIGPLMMNGQHISQVAAGTALQPGLTFELDPDTGFFQPAVGQLAVSVNGVQKALWTDAGLNMPGAVVIGGTQIYGDAIEIGLERTADGASYVDFHATVASDYDARIMRAAGVNGGLTISNRGVSSLILNSETAGGNVIIQTQGANRIGVWDTGNVHFYGSVDIAGQFDVTGSIGTAANLGVAGRATIQIIDTNGVQLPRLVGGVTQCYIYADQGSFIVSTNRNNPGAEKYFTFGANGIATFHGGTVWTSANDGAGSGLDADLLDGLQASQFQGALGFNPVQQGTGIGQNNFNTIKIGWSPGGQLLATVDSTNQGAFAMLSGPASFGVDVSSTGSITGTTCNGTNYVWGNNQILTNGSVNASGLISSGNGAGTGLQFSARDNSTNVFLLYALANYTRLWNNAIGDYLEFHPTAFRSVGDQTADCGGPSQRWFTVWCRTSTMATSDLREKDWRGGLNDAELAVAKDLAKEIGIYRWLSDIEKDGDAAKLNCGFAAQHVMAVFEKHGLNALDYAFIRYDEWEESTSKGPPIGDCPEPKCLDEERGIWDRTDDREHEVITHPAGNRYSVMLADLLAFMLVGMEQRIAALE